MSEYKILPMDNLPEVLKKKPRLVTCIGMTLGLFIVIMSAIFIGIFIGYTYCYLEYHTGFRKVTANFTRSAGFHVVLKEPESEEVKRNRTINGALMSSALISSLF